MHHTESTVGAIIDAAEPMDGMTFEPVPGWPNLPDEIDLRGQATSVAVDAQDQVYVFNRGTHPLIIFDASGNLVTAWADDGAFDRPHSITIDHEGFIWFVDEGGHTIEKRTAEGEVVLTLGARGSPAPLLSGEPFNRPTDVALHEATGDIFVSDGYGNCRIHRYNASGEHLLSWGEPGTDPGQFSLPHNLVVTADDRVVVCDRESFRVQVFSLEGEFIEQWFLHRPFCIAQQRGRSEFFYVGEMRSAIANRRGVPRLGSCVKVLDQHGRQLVRFGGDLPGFEPDQFMSLHSIDVDSHGDVYVAEVSNSWIRDFGAPESGEIVCLRKWKQVG